MRKHKKGFTIVELVIVIAVIAVLTAVLVPTFIHLSNKAKKASDQSLVNNLNTALAMEKGETGKDPKTMHDAVLGLEHQGYKLPQLVTKSGEDLVYSINENKFYLSGDAEGDKVNYWHIEASKPTTQEWSIYAYGWSGDATGLTVGFDAGEESISEVEYVGGHNVVIRTNGGKLTVRAPEDIVKHYGEATVVEIKEVASSSYHLYGEVTVKLTVEDGRAVVENGGKVATLEVAKGAEEVVTESGSKVENLRINADADIQSAKLQVVAGSDVKVVINNSSSVDTSAIAESGVKVVDATEEAIGSYNVYNLTKNKYETLSTQLYSGNYLLLKDIVNNFRCTENTFGINTTLDLNGFSISTSDDCTMNICRSKGSNVEFCGEGKLINTSTDTNSCVIKHSGNANVTVGPGVKLEGGYGGIFLCAEKAATINFAGEYKATKADSFGFYRNGTLQDTTNCPTINFEKTAKIEVEDGAAVYAAGYAIWNIKGGEFKSNDCFEIKAGVLTIEDGKFETTASTKSHVPNGNGTSSNGYALAIIWNDGYGKPLTVTLNGGKYVGPVALLCDEEDQTKVSNIVFNNNIGVVLG